MTDPQPYPIGVVIFATAVAADRSSPGYLTFNRDMLPGGTDKDGVQYVWGVRVTLQGHNGYKHEKEWLGFQTPRGTACSSWGGIAENSAATWVRVTSIDDALKNGPDHYGPSR